MKSRWAFTLIEIMLAAGLIAVIAAIASAGYVKSRSTAQKRLCIENLRQIDSAKERWASDNGASIGDSIPGGKNALKKGSAKAFAKGFDEYINVIPTCPAGGTYTIGNIGKNPTCSISGHALKN